MNHFDPRTFVKSRTFQHLNLLILAYYYIMCYNPCLKQKIVLTLLYDVLVNCLFSSVFLVYSWCILYEPYIYTNSQVGSTKYVYSRSIGKIPEKKVKVVKGESFLRNQF